MIYCTSTQKILEWGDKADKRNQSDKKSLDTVYITNIFTKLIDIHQKKKNFFSCDDFDVHDNMVLHAVQLFLLKVTKKYQLSMGGMKTSQSPSHFAFFLPSDWDDRIREDLIRPLFIRAGLIEETDHDSRLLFFTQIETLFGYMQSLKNDEDRLLNAKIENGKQYMMCGLKFTGQNLTVNIDLFTAHYPPLTAIKHHFVTEFLNSIFFDVLIDPQIESDIENCLNLKGFDPLEIETREILDTLIHEYKIQEVIIIHKRILYF